MSGFTPIIRRGTGSVLGMRRISAHPKNVSPRPSMTAMRKVSIVAT